jgi:hypothetical protein
MSPAQGLDALPAPRNNSRDQWQEAALPQILPLLVLTARPAAGKSEIIDYWSHMTDGRRADRYHLGRLRMLDDFPLLWAWLEEDSLLEQMGLPRLHTDAQGYFLRPEFWNLLIRRLVLEYEKIRRDVQPDETVIIEFSRGSEHGGYRAALPELGADILSRACCLYLQVSFAESLRKNKRRFNPQRPDSILEHSLPDEKLARLYQDDDWHELCDAQSAYLQISGFRLPCVIVDNEDDLTTEPGPALGDRLHGAMARLWQLYRQSVG